LLENIDNKVTISLEKIILQGEKEQCAIYICKHFIWGLQLGLGLSWGIKSKGWG